SWRTRRCRSACAIISRWRSRTWRLCRFELIMPRPSALWLPESQARARNGSASCPASLPQRADRYRASTRLYQPLRLLLLLGGDGARYRGYGMTTLAPDRTGPAAGPATGPAAGPAVGPAIGPAAGPQTPDRAQEPAAGPARPARSAGSVPDDGGTRAWLRRKAVAAWMNVLIAATVAITVLTAGVPGVHARLALCALPRPAGQGAVERVRAQPAPARLGPAVEPAGAPGGVRVLPDVGEGPARPPGRQHLPAEVRGLLRAPDHQHRPGRELPRQE